MLKGLLQTGIFMKRIKILEKDLKIHLTLSL